MATVTVFDAGSRSGAPPFSSGTACAPAVVLERAELAHNGLPVRRVRR